MTMFVIVSTGPAATSGMDRVISPRTGSVLRFLTREGARAYADDIRPEVPSKYYPLVVREEHAHAVPCRNAIRR